MQPYGEGCELAPHPAERRCTAAASPLHCQLSRWKGVHSGGHPRREAALQLCGGACKRSVVLIYAKADTKAGLGGWALSRSAGQQAGAQAPQALQERWQHVSGLQPAWDEDAKRVHCSLKQCRSPRAADPGFPDIGSSKCWKCCQCQDAVRLPSPLPCSVDALTVLQCGAPPSPLPCTPTVSHAGPL